MGVPAIDLAEASHRLAELVDQATRSGEVVITRGGHAVAKIIPLNPQHGPRRPGSARGQVHMAQDFDATPEEFFDIP